MSIESHPSPTGSSSSSLFGAGDPITQPSPAKPTWAQILNSNPNPPSNNNASASLTANSANNNNNLAAPGNSPSSSSSSSQHSAPTKTISPSPSGTTTRPAHLPNSYEQQQQQQQSQMNNWSLNFNQTSSWMMNDEDSQRAPPTQASLDNTQLKTSDGGGGGFDRLDSASPTADWNKPVTASSNSTANGWSSFQQSNPSRSNNQWSEMNNFYGGNPTSTNTFHLPPTSNDNNSSNNNNNNNHHHSSTWQDSDALNSKPKASASIAALKTAIALGGNPDAAGANGEAMITYVPQPKLVEQLGWDEPEVQVGKRGHFDDGTAIWGDPTESTAVPVKKWTNGAKSALANATNIEQQQQQQQIVQKPVSTPTRTVLNDENWSKQQSPSILQQQQQQQQHQQQQPPPAAQAASSSQWTDVASASLEASNLSQAPSSFRPHPNNWNPGNHSSDDWFGEGVVDTSDWGLQGAPHKAPFDPNEGQIDTSGWGVQGGMPGQMSMNRARLMNEYELHEGSHDARMPPFESDPYRQAAELKNPLLNMPSSHHPFPPRPSSLYSHQPGNILRPINPNGGLPTPPGANLSQASHSSPKLLTSSPVPNTPTFKGNNGNSQTPTPAQQQQQQQQGSSGGVNPANNGAVHAQIMNQFRLAVQAGLISQDLLNTKLPPYMLQLLQRLFEHQQKFQQLTLSLNDLSKNKSHLPMQILQSEYERFSKLIALKQQEMLTVQKEIKDAHAKLKQQSSQLMSNGPPPPPSSSSSDQSRLSQWTTKSAIGGQRQMFPPPPPGLSQKDWQSDPSDGNENWDNSQGNDTNVNAPASLDSHPHSNSAFADPFSNLVDDIDGPPPFIPGQLWNWKSPLSSAEDDPHATPSSFTLGPKGAGSPMGNLNVGGAESAFSNPQLMHPYRQLPPSNRSQWQHEQAAFAPPMNDWNKPPLQYRNTSKPPPPPHPSFGGGAGAGAGYRPYM